MLISAGPCSSDCRRAPADQRTWLISTRPTISLVDVREYSASSSAARRALHLFARECHPGVEQSNSNTAATWAEQCSELGVRDNGPESAAFCRPRAMLINRGLERGRFPERVRVPQTGRHIASGSHVVGDPP